MEKLREAYNCFTRVTAKGCSGRMLHDQRYNQVIMLWIFNAGYDSDTAKELLKVRNISDKHPLAVNHVKQLYASHNLSIVSFVYRYY